MLLRVSLDCFGQLDGSRTFLENCGSKVKVPTAAPAIETDGSLQSSQATMDAPLRCNSLKCRQRLADRAVVTTCRLVMRCLPKPVI